MAARGKKGAKKKAQKKGRFGALVSSFLFGEPLDDATTARVRELTGLAMIGGSLWLFLSIWTFNIVDDAGNNLGGLLGHYIAEGALTTLGVAAYLLAALGVCWGCIVVARKKVDLPAIRIMGAVVFVFSFAFMLDLGFGAPLEVRGDSKDCGAPPSAAITARGAAARTAGARASASITARGATARTAVAAASAPTITSGRTAKSASAGGLSWLLPTRSLETLDRPHLLHDMVQGRSHHMPHMYTVLHV